MLVFGRGPRSGLRVNFRDRSRLGFKIAAKVIFQDRGRDQISIQESWSSLVVDVRFQNGCRNWGQVSGIRLG